MSASWYLDGGVMCTAPSEEVDDFVNSLFEVDPLDPLDLLEATVVDDDAGSSGGGGQAGDAGVPVHEANCEAANQRVIVQDPVEGSHPGTYQPMDSRMDAEPSYGAHSGGDGGLGDEMSSLSAGSLSNGGVEAGSSSSGGGGGGGQAGDSWNYRRDGQVWPLHEAIYEAAKQRVTDGDPAEVSHPGTYQQPMDSHMDAEPTHEAHSGGDRGLDEEMSSLSPGSVSDGDGDATGSSGGGGGQGGQGANGGSNHIRDEQVWPVHEAIYEATEKWVTTEGLCLGLGLDPERTRLYHAIKKVEEPKKGKGKRKDPDIWLCALMAVPERQWEGWTTKMLTNTSKNRMTSTDSTKVKKYWEHFCLDLTHHYMIPRFVGNHRYWYETYLYFQSFFFALCRYPESLPTDPLSIILTLHPDPQYTYPLARYFHQALLEKLPETNGGGGGGSGPLYAPRFEQYPFTAEEVLPRPRNRQAKGRRQVPQLPQPVVVSQGGGNGGVDWLKHTFFSYFLPLGFLHAGITDIQEYERQTRVNLYAWAIPFLAGGCFYDEENECLLALFNNLRQYRHHLYPHPADTEAILRDGDYAIRLSTSIPGTLTFDYKVPGEPKVQSLQVCVTFGSRNSDITVQYHGGGGAVCEDKLDTLVTKVKKEDGLKLTKLSYNDAKKRAPKVSSLPPPAQAGIRIYKRRAEGTGPQKGKRNNLLRVQSNQPQRTNQERTVHLLPQSPQILTPASTASTGGGGGGYSYPSSPETVVEGQLDTTSGGGGAEVYLGDGAVDKVKPPKRKRGHDDP